MKQEMLFDFEDYVPDKAVHRNSNLMNAFKNRNDEFYTVYETLVPALEPYKEQFRDKVVYCPCDCEWSAFVRYFKTFGREIGIRGLLYSGIDKDGKGTDYRSDKALDMFRRADVVVTNPPFSLFRDFFTLLMREKKKFLVIGNLNAVSYKCVYPYFVRGNVWIRYDGGLRYNGIGSKINNSLWFGNIDAPTVPFKVLTAQFGDRDYERYDNFDAIDVPKSRLIPKDYGGIMGVPISFCYMLNRNQFDVLDFTDYGSKYRTKHYKDTMFVSGNRCYFNTTQNFRGMIKLENHPDDKSYYICDCEYMKATYTRILIRRK